MPLTAAEALRKRAYRFLARFDLDQNAKAIGPFALRDWNRAPLEHGIYQIGLMESGAFRPRYLGKSVRQPLKVRLSQHFADSTNVEIRQRLAAGETLAFRAHPISLGNATVAVINAIEGMYLKAFEEDYVWNRRQEWEQHFAVEDIVDT